jgi:hypothetical protein
VISRAGMKKPTLEDVAFQATHPDTGTRLTA